MRLGDTPVPIPNTKVKTYAADGTMLETAWESRWLPEQKNKTGITSDQEEQPRLLFLMTDKTVKTLYIENRILIIIS